MATEKAPAFQFYPKDFLSDDNVMAMSLTERGAYITLMSVCWLQGSLAGDTSSLSRILKISPDRTGRLKPYLERCFLLGDDGRWRHPRLEKERQKQATYRERATRGGTATQAARKQRTSTAKRQLKSNTPISNLQSSSTPEVSTEQKPLEGAPHPVKEFLTLYVSLFKELIGTEPVLVRGRDAKITQVALADVGPERAHALLRAFFASRDPFILRSGYGLNVFATQINKLIVDASATAERPDMNGHLPPCKTMQDCTRKILDDARRERVGV